MYKREILITIKKVLEAGKSILWQYHGNVLSEFLG
jgi:hypothetical protein